jgi:hypothetical protein
LRRGWSALEKLLIPRKPSCWITSGLRADSGNSMTTGGFQGQTTQDLIRVRNPNSVNIEWLPPHTSDRDSTR